MGEVVLGGCRYQRMGSEVSAHMGCGVFFFSCKVPLRRFFSRLALRLLGERHTVHRIRFNSGDVLYWNGLPAWRYREKAETLRDLICCGRMRFASGCSWTC